MKQKEQDYLPKFHGIKAKDVQNIANIERHQNNQQAQTTETFEMLGSLEHILLLTHETVDTRYEGRAFLLTIFIIQLNYFHVQTKIITIFQKESSPKDKYFREMSLLFTMMSMLLATITNSSLAFSDGFFLSRKYLPQSLTKNGFYNLSMQPLLDRSSIGLEM